MSYKPYLKKIIQDVITLAVRPGVEKRDHTNISQSGLSIRMSHICSQWRSVALGMKELWRLVKIPDCCPEMFEVFASRCPSSLAIDVRRRNITTHSRKPTNKSFGFSFDPYDLYRANRLRLGGRYPSPSSRTFSVTQTAQNRIFAF